MNSAHSESPAGVLGMLAALVQAAQDASGTGEIRPR